MMKQSGFYLFTVSFLTSLAVLILIMSAVIFTSAKFRKPEEVPGPSDLSAEKYQPSAEDGFRILLIWTGDGKQAENFAVLTVDPLSVTASLFELSGEFVSEVGGKSKTLLEHDAYAGSAEAELGAENLLGVKIDRWVRLGRNGAVRIINALGGIEWEFSEPFESAHLSIPVGRHLLDGETVMTLIDENAGKKLPGKLRVTADLLNQRITASLLNRGDWFFQIFVSNAESSISQFDYQKNKKMLRWFLTRDERKMQILHVEGDADEEGKMILSEEDRLMIGQLTGCKPPNA